MPPPLALLLTAAFVFWLLRQDSKRTPGTTRALWIPLIWLSIISSRFLSEWLNVGPTFANNTDGSPVDQPVFLVLWIVAAWIVSRRSVPWASVAAVNLGLALFLVYGAISIAWSDFPFVAFKRWVKVLGHGLMVLVILTEPNPREAMRALFKRCGFLLIPTSVLLIKYYPGLGRGFSFWTGEAYNTGVTTNKNSLGVLCLMIGFFFAWNLLVYLRELPPPMRKRERNIALLMLGMTLWLLHMADSATSLACLLTSMGVLVTLGIRRLREKRLLMYVTAGLALLVVLDSTFNLTEAAIEALGRDATLTDRTELWEDVLAMTVNPLIGAGFESFWLGERVATLWAKWEWRPNQAHNGYIEVYLNGGWLGLVFLAVLIASCYRKAKLALVSSPSIGRFRMACLAMLLLYNYTEATFKALHPMFFVLFVIAIDLPALASQTSAVAASPPVPSGGNGKRDPARVGKLGVATDLPRSPVTRNVRTRLDNSRR